MSNSNPQLKEYIREQLTNRLVESVENISEGGQYRTVKRRLSPPNPATSRPAPQGLNMALAAGLGIAQGAQSAADEWNENKEKGMSDDENNEKTTIRALTAGGVEAVLAFALAKAGQKMAMTIPISRKYKSYKYLKGPVGTLAGAGLALEIGNTIDNRVNQWTNKNEDPRAKQKNQAKKDLEELEDRIKQEEQRRKIQQRNPYIH